MPFPALRQDILRLQRRNYERKLRQAREGFADPPYVARYGREYLKHVRQFTRIATREEVLRKALAAEIIYHGDYHTLRHSQRSILAMLQKLADRRPLVLCLEMIHAVDQPWLDLYQAGKIEETEFLKRIHYAKKWAYNFNPWRHILAFCREKNIHVIGINTTADSRAHALRERDRFSARIIAKALIRFQPALIYVIDGDYHMSPDHLPLQVERMLEPLGLKPRRLILYQNVERLYWKLAEAGHEEAQAVQIDEQSYCLMNTVPAIKLQSYLDWLEYAEDGYFPVKGDWAELWGDTYYAQIENTVRDLDQLLHLDFPMKRLQSLTVFSSRNLDFSDKVQSHPALAPLWPYIRHKLRRDEGFLLEIEIGHKLVYWIYLPNASINQAAEESAHFVHAILRGSPHPAKAPRDAFYQEALTEMLGFFGSKLINDRRKAPTEASLRRYLSALRKNAEITEAPESDDTLIARYLLQHIHLERRNAPWDDFEKKFSRIYRQNHPRTHAFATQLGYILGSHLYAATKQGLVPAAEVRELFHQHFGQPGQAPELYRTWVQRFSALSRSKLKKGSSKLSKS